MALLASPSVVRSMTADAGATEIIMVSPEVTPGGTVTSIGPLGVLAWNCWPSATRSGTVTVSVPIFLVGSSEKIALASPKY